MTKFSIIMPVYNNEKYFPMAVESIEKQNYDNYELIIVDDGSTDRTSLIADTLAEKNSHIKVIHQENQWIFNSFNNGIAMAAGDYIYILNSDDKLASGALDIFDSKIREFHPDVIWTGVLAQTCDSEQNVISDGSNTSHRVKADSFYATKKEVEKAWPYFYYSGLAMDQANLYRREIMQSELFRNDVYGADTLYNISIADKIHTALILKEPVYIHYLYKSSDRVNTSRKYYPYTHAMYNEIFHQYQILFQKWELPREIYVGALWKRRISGLTSELRGLQAANCPLAIEEKLRLTFQGWVDETIKECISERDQREEWESRILSATRELLLTEELSTKSSMYFIYELLESLLSYEKEEEDYKRIKDAVNHPLNPFQIGNVFYQKLIHGRK